MPIKSHRLPSSLHATGLQSRDFQDPAQNPSTLAQIGHDVFDSPAASQKRMSWGNLFNQAALQKARPVALTHRRGNRAESLNIQHRHLIQARHGCCLIALYGNTVGQSMTHKGTRHLMLIVKTLKKATNDHSWRVALYDLNIRFDATPHRRAGLP